VKQSIRDEILRVREEFGEEEVQLKSSMILDRLFRTPEYQAAQEIFTFVSFGNEVDTYGIILNAFMSNKKVYAPKIMKRGIIEFYQIGSIEELQPSKLGILEPTSENLGELKQDNGSQLMIVPGVAFDEECNRLGYGGGYYDRYFAKNLDCQVPKIALCYELQMLHEVPTEEYDYKVDKIITEKREIIRY
jgi:5-formyltetrahydrofolate cyclo-ligase